ncbi:hypothetical protein BDP27DRAFT_1317152 [Rhodocollybia butyracea]|uniref:Uncharacterized protein n=1 Tax=Rhodocollybia butyracea TaxID=206335 RepID=A0A9P5Q5J0_9AGAR|nr:hypothetical protein BDP27DRAFT_1317152 [Rhodocollybia butyracea]
MPPPIIDIPRAKQSFPIVQAGHVHLRNASDTIHQHRNSLASQLRILDSRWAHLFSVAPVLNKLTKGRQRPEEFCKNTEALYEDVQTALDEARKQKMLRPADEQDSIVPGPPPSLFARTVKALSSIIERVEPSASRSSSSNRHTKRRRSPRKKSSRHSIKYTSASSSLYEHKIDRDRGRRSHRYGPDEQHLTFEKPLQHQRQTGHVLHKPPPSTEKRSRSWSKHRQRSPSRHHRRRDGGKKSTRKDYPNDMPGPKQPPVPSLPPADGIPPIYARFATTPYDRDDEQLEPPVIPFAIPNPEHHYSARRYPPPHSQTFTQYHENAHRETHHPPSSYYHDYSQKNGQTPRFQNNYASQLRDRDQGRDRERYPSSSRSPEQPVYPRRTVRQHEPTYSSTSTPVMPVNSLPTIPAPSSYRHLSRSRYPPSFQAGRSSDASQRKYMYSWGDSGGSYRDEDRQKDGYKDGYRGSGDRHANGYSRTSPRHHKFKSPKSSPEVVVLPHSPLIMRSKFQENFSVHQSER